MFTVDIVMPMGGFAGGVEDVISLWTKNIDQSKMKLRVFHMARGGQDYLNGYPYAYFVKKELDTQNCDIEFGVAAYGEFLKKYGIPDICIATNWPIVTEMCHQVRKRYGFTYRLLSWVHNSICKYKENGFGGAEVLKNADAHLALSNNICKEIVAEYSDAKVYVIGNPILRGVAKETFSSDLMLVFIGRLTEIKRLDIILEAMYKAKAPWKLKIIGDGDIYENVKSWVDLLKLNQQVKFLGWQSDPFSFCQDASALVLASEFEGFPMVALQASAHGMTVISTPVSGVVDYLVEGKNGYFFDQEDADGLANILNDLSDGTKSFANPKECVKSVEPYFVDNYFENIHRILEEFA